MRIKLILIILSGYTRILYIDTASMLEYVQQIIIIKGSSVTMFWDAQSVDFGQHMLFFTAAGSSRREKFYSGTYLDRSYDAAVYQIKESNNTISLTIRGVDTSHTGRYECYGFYSTSLEKLDLLVLESESETGYKKHNVEESRSQLVLLSAAVVLSIIILLFALSCICKQRIQTKQASDRESRGCCPVFTQDSKELEAPEKPRFKDLNLLLMNEKFADHAILETKLMIG